MTTTYEARAALYSVLMGPFPHSPAAGVVKAQLDEHLPALIAAVRAEYKSFERTYHDGYAEGVAEYAQTLVALREALGPVLVEVDELIENDRWADGPPNSAITRLEYAVIALRAALAATPTGDNLGFCGSCGRVGFYAGDNRHDCGKSPSNTTD